MADFFADLLPKQPSNSQNGSQKPPSFEDDVLVSPTASSDQARASSSAAMSGGPMVRRSQGWGSLWVPPAPVISPSDTPWCRA